MRRACRGTPVQEACEGLLAGLTAEQRAGLGLPLTRLQRLNLMLVLLVVQSTQVLLLAVAVSASGRSTATCAERLSGQGRSQFLS